MIPPTYSDGVYAVEQFDWVEFIDPAGGLRGEGQITRVYPRKGEARVRFEQPFHHRARGQRRMRAVRLPIEALELIRRDG
ncbi:MAG: hypothetical protein NXH91_11990 [Phyllobacteriaceae bacterium]|nr:hypothetical protein [Phyllobacteriaceae bacterium]